MTFEESDLAAMAAEQEVDIETRSAAGEAHRVLDEGDGLLSHVFDLLVAHSCLLGLTRNFAEHG